MHLATPSPMVTSPRPDATLSVPLRLISTYRRSYPGTAGLADAVVDRYLRDLVEGSGRKYHPDVLHTGRNTSFTTMAAQILLDVGPVQPSVNLIVLSHATPDIDPRTSAACFMVDTAPGAPTAFAISEQGRVAPFTALRVAGAFVQGEISSRVLLMALDQRSVPWGVDDPEQVPTADASVALLLDRVEPGEDVGALLQQHTDVGPDDVGMVLAANLPALTSTPLPVRLVAGRGVPPEQCTDLTLSVTYAPAGPLCTSTWDVLAAAVSDQGDRPATRVILVEYDRVLRYLCVAAIDIHGRTQEVVE